eukprot:CAMPEP_0175059696 /NCGR_PEP_ID=MMETSP0052_2-20121109/12577_1 /TAXON_ID=51329 ORGANISM="Polytomella parva, Strain SAG 63-3" /NCGR_SAMPLE_ID=MMETSP0052_2 /ASSEMBLY_ACC=CAM_ASM_000194 /LENGTH=65 /DNA_ID=CAMNT_0016325277 /DNA_START=657 /DNA_END=851 /DNA_ORIENTATION=+
MNEHDKVIHELPYSNGDFHGHGNDMDLKAYEISNPSAEDNAFRHTTKIIDSHHNWVNEDAVGKYW